METLSKEECDRLRQNLSEDNAFRKQLDKYFKGNMPKHEVINVCSTPNILKLLGSKAKKIVLSQKDLQNAVAAERQRRSGHIEGHEIPKEELYKLSEAIRNPIMVLNGNKRNQNSVVILSELLNKNNENILIPIALDRQNGRISNISTLYGKKNLFKYLSVNLKDILAVNIKKADMLADIGVQFSKSIYDTVTCYDDSIAYTTKNVKYQKRQKIENKEENSTMSTQKKIDEMYTQQAQLEAAYQAEMQSIIEADIVPAIEEDIEFDEVIDMTKQRERETEELENSRKKAQEMSEELIAAQKHTSLTEINNNIVEMVKNTDLSDMFLNEVMDYSKGTDTMLMLFDLADNAKNAEAQNILGVCYFSGTNVMPDLQKSMEYFRDAAEQGHAGAARNLAIAMESAQNPDKNEIISLYEKAADKNDAYAINNLAVVYLTGDGVKKDPKRAAKLFERAAKLGDDYAMVNLAYCYSIGNGVKYSEKETFKLYEKAAEKGNIEGLRNTAECLLAGKGTKQDPETALSYFSKAAQLGDIKSQERIEELSDKLSGMKHDEVVAGTPSKKKSLSEVLNMGKQAAESNKNPDEPEKTVPKTKGDR